MSMTSRWLRIGLALAVAGCGDDGPADPGTGTVEVTTVSTGEAIDADGYRVQVGGAGTLDIGANATASLAEVPSGDIEVRLTGVRGNCAVEDPNPRLVRIVAGETLRTDFEVACADTPLLGRLVFYSLRDGSYELYSMNVDGSDVLRLTNTPPEEREFYPAVSPDGSRIAFVNRIGPEDDFNTAYLYVMNADGTDAVELPVLDGGFIDAPVWSPDGSQIAFSGWIDDNGYEIWVINADGSGLRNLTNTADIGEFWPSWSPDGGRILFTGEANPQRLEIMNADGTGRAPFRDGAFWGSWSPDGERIAFLPLSDDEGLSVMEADGSNATPLAPADEGVDVMASWSPSGDRLAYIHIVDPDVDMWVINADGSGAVNLTENDVFDYMGPQAWGP
jgi:Tol biopolymer transport system component